MSRVQRERRWLHGQWTEYGFWRRYYTTCERHGMEFAKHWNLNPAMYPAPVKRRR